jgi:hypothetical protein
MPTTKLLDVLRTKPRRMRAKPARGLATGARVDRTGGDRGAGVIRGVAVVTRGEALGHGYWLDSQFLDQVSLAMAQNRAGLKSRFTHPGLSADGLGKYLGRMKGVYRDGNVIRTDLHISPIAHKSPDGDLAEYVMGLAEDDPAAFGTSIVFVPDADTEDLFAADHKNEEGHFVSPDPENHDNLPHARLLELLADDVVDDPAANPGGLFHRGQEIAQEADALLSYGLGLGSERPRLIHLDVDSDRIAQFVQRFLQNHNLELSEKKTMADDVTPADVNLKSEVAVPGAANETLPELDLVPFVYEVDRSECKRFIEAFGLQGGAWFAEGLTFDQCRDKQLALLQAEKAALEARLAGVDRGEAEPVNFRVGPEEQPGGKAAQQAAQNSSDGLVPLIAFNAAAMAKLN